MARGGCPSHSRSGPRPVLRRLVYSAPVEVVRDGEVLFRNVRREFMTDEELRAQLRDGRMSVIRTDGARPEARPGKAGIRR
jgi:uncharacterized membrane protein YcaP (DUF421 family)